jgi:phosphatidylinositol alpha-1,6-mannosyltransferase
MVSSKLLFLAGDFPPVEGGISQYLLELIRALPPNRVEVIGLPTPGWKDFDQGQAFSIHRMNLPETWDTRSQYFKLLGPLYLLKWLKIRQGDFILCGQAHHSLLMAAWVISKITKMPFGVFVYGLDLLRPQSSKQRGIFNWLLSSADVVFAISQQTAELASQLGVLEDRIRVIHPIINPSELQIKVPPRKLKEIYKIQDKKLILSVGRLVERKGFDTLLKALPLIVQRVPKIHYLIVGGGPFEEELRALVSNLGLSRYVTFAGPKLHSEVASFYAACDIFAMISREIPEKGDLEGFGIVFIEANYFGKPVVGGRSGGVIDAIIDGQTGLLVNPSDPAQVTDALIRLLTEPEFAQRLGENGKKRVLNHFAGRSVANELSESLLEMVK